MKLYGYACATAENSEQQQLCRRVFRRRHLDATEGDIESAPCGPGELVVIPTL